MTNIPSGVKNRSWIQVVFVLLSQLLLLTDIVHGKQGITTKNAAVVPNVHEQRRRLAQCTDPLQCAIQRLQITAPDQVIQVPSTTTTTVLCLGTCSPITISKIFCNNFNIANIPSTYVPPTTMQVGLQNVGLICTLHYKWPGSSSWTTIQNDIKVTVTGITATGNIVIDKDPKTQLPSSMYFASQSCKVNVPNFKIDITTGTTQANIENWLVGFLGTATGPIASMLEDEVIYPYFCTQVGALTAKNGTYALTKQLDPILTRLMTSKPGSVPQVYETGAAVGKYYNWHKSVFSLTNYASSAFKSFSTTSLFNCFVSKYPLVGKLMVEPSIDVVAEYFTQGTGEYTFDLSNEPFPFRVSLLGTLANVTIKTIHIKGLNSFQNFDVLEPVSLTSNVSLSTRVKFSKMDVSIRAEVDSTIVPNGYTSDYTFHFQLLDTTLGFDVGLALSDAKILKSYTQQLVAKPMCLLQTVDYLNVTSLVATTVVGFANVTEVHVGPVESTIGRDVVNLANNVVQLLVNTNGYGPLLTKVLEGAAQGPIRDIINDQIAKMTAAQVSQCANFNPLPINPPVYVPLATNPVLQLIDTQLNDVLGPKEMNKILSCASNGTGSLYVSAAGWKVGVKLDTFSNFSLLHVNPKNPAKLYNLANTLQWDNFVITIEPPAALEHSRRRLQTFSSDQISSKIPAIPAGFTLLPPNTLISVNLSHLYIYADVLAQMNQNKLFNLQLGQLMVGGCLESTMSTMALRALQMGVVDSRMLLTSNGVTKFSRDISYVVGLVMRGVNTPITMTKINDFLSTSISKSNAVCANNGVAVAGMNDVPPPHVPDAGTPEDTMAGTIVMVSIIVLAYVAYELYQRKYGPPRKQICLWGGQRPQNRASVSSTAVVPTAQSVTPSSSEKSESGDVVIATQPGNTVSVIEPWYVAQWHHLECDRIIVLDKRIPLIVRLFALAISIVTIILFLISNLEPGAVDVVLKIKVGQYVLAPPPVFQFGLISTIHDMWAAKVWFLAVIVAFFSGAWPYLKLGFLLFSLILPPGLMSPSMREAGLMFLDAYGKWSLIDGFVMVMFMCAFWLNLVITPQLVINVTVLPHFGFNGFLIATMFSLVAGHVIVGMHRHVLAEDAKLAKGDHTSSHSHSGTTKALENGDGDNKAVAHAQAHPHPHDAHIHVKTRGSILPEQGNPLHKSHEYSAEEIAHAVAPHPPSARMEEISFEDESQALVNHTFLVSFYTLFPNVDMEAFERSLKSAKAFEREAHGHGVEMSVVEPTQGGTRKPFSSTEQHPRSLASLNIVEVFALFSHDPCLADAANEIKSKSITGELLSLCESVSDVQELFGLSPELSSQIYSQVSDWKDSGVTADVLQIALKTPPKTFKVAPAPDNDTSSGGLEGESSSTRSIFSSMRYNRRDYRALLKAYVKKGKPLLHVRSTRFGRICLGILLFGVSLLLVVSTSIKTITFNISGLTGFLLKDDAITEYSFVSIGAKVPQASGTPNDPMVFFIEVVYLAFGMIMPLLFLVASMILWYAPLSHSKWASRMLVVTEVLNAWSALDVFIVSIAAALLEIQQFASFIVGENCDGINLILQDYLDTEMKHVDKCFDVQAMMQFSSWTLFLAALFLNLIAFATLRAAEIALHKGGALVETEDISAFKDDEDVVHDARRPTARMSSLFLTSSPTPPPPPPPAAGAGAAGGKRRGRVSVYHHGEILPVDEAAHTKEKKDDSEKSWKLFPKWFQISGMMLRLLLWLNMIKVKQGNGEVAPVDYRCVRWYLTHALDAIAAFICRIPLPATQSSKAQNAFENWKKKYDNPTHNNSPFHNTKSPLANHHRGVHSTNHHMEAHVPENEFNSALDGNAYAARL